MKKYVAIAVMICLCASLLMGCGGSGGGGKNVGAQSKAEAQEKTAQAEVQKQAEAQEKTAQKEVLAVEAQEEVQADQQVTRELPSQTDGYLIFVKDANTDEPLEGVKVQFCSDTECILGETGDDGTAGFDREAGTYTIHILQPPEGYAADDTEYAAPLTPGTTTIVLHAETGS